MFRPMLSKFVIDSNIEETKSQHLFNRNGFNKNGTGKRMKPKPIYFGARGGQDEDSPPRKMTKLNNYGNNRKLNGVSKKELIQKKRENLEIFSVRENILDWIRRNRTLIILAQTGIGKTTQIPQYISEAGLMGQKKIAITQPRRIAAISLAMRVAQEHNIYMSIGEYVGYSVRFENVTSDKTKIKFVTDGMLLREAMEDKLLMDYSFIILDEAHERTVNTDILFGIVKNAQKIRENKKLTPLNIIIMSATMNVDHFSNFFNKCEILNIISNEVKVDQFNLSVPDSDYQHRCVQVFFDLHKDAPTEHGFLIFLTGQEEVENCAQQIRNKAKTCPGPPVKVLTLFAAQSSQIQMAVFDEVPTGTRKVVVSTNIAETSLTISGIKYVIDSGMVKLRTYHPATGLETLKVHRISQEQSVQRAGRAGRESSGFAYQLYTEQEYLAMAKNTIPEIQRVNLNLVALQLLSMGINLKEFDFLDKPSDELISGAYEQLHMLGAIDNVRSLKLTDLGRKMSKFPLDPRFTKIIFAAEQHKCLYEILTIVAILSSEQFFVNPVTKREEANNARVKFRSCDGDLFTYFNAYKEFRKIEAQQRREWCQEYFMHMRHLLYVGQVYNQLKEICKKFNMNISNCSNNDLIKKCLLSGLFMNVARLYKDREYITIDKHQLAKIHPSSHLYEQNAQYVIFTEVVQTTKSYLRGLTVIEETWLQEIVPDYIKNHPLRGSVL